VATDGLPRLPLLAPWYRVIGAGDRLLLEHGSSLVVLEGAAVRALLPALLPLLDGTRTVDDLVRRLGEQVRPAIEQALATLAGHGVVVEGPDAPHTLAVAGLFGLAPGEAATRLECATVDVVGGAAVGEDVARLLRLTGIERVRPAAWRARRDADLVVVAPAPGELDRVPAWNRRAWSASSPWVLVRPFDGRFTGVGPLVVPGESACHECSVRRRGACFGFGADVFDVEAAPVAAVAPPSIASAIAALAADVALRWTIGRDTTLPGLLHVLEAAPDLCITRHTVLRVPRCDVCSQAARTAPPLPWHEAVAA
jgi:bacteriocin biosynthesis cyclodehydratase domain-containing protein